MVRITGSFDVDGHPVVESIEGEQAHLFEQHLSELDTVQMTLNKAIVVSLKDRVRQDRESYSLDEELSIDCVSLFESNDDTPGILFEEFPTELHDRVLDKYDLGSVSIRDDYEKEWQEWYATVNAIERPDRTIDLSSVVSTCPGCGADLDGDEAFCPECGQDLSATVTTCPECEASLDGDEAFCPECGEDLSSVVLICPECEADLDGDEAFCPECGEDLSE